MDNKKFTVTASIIDQNLALVGFVVKGKGCSLGGFGDECIERPMRREDMLAQRFKNHQIDMSMGTIKEIGKFRINQLPMVVTVGNQFNSVDNGVSLVSKYVQDNKIAGFDVRVNAMNGEVKPITYQAIIAYAKWFKAENFTVKHSDGGTKAFITGKGMSLDELPTKVINSAKTSNAKKRKPSTVAQNTAKNVVPNRAESGFDILDIYDLVSKYNGQLLFFPDEKYVAQSPNGAAAEKDFVPYGIGELASPRLSFNSAKLNVNAGFQKPGYVTLEINGHETSITTFTYRTKSLFSLGKNYVKKFGIAVPTTNENELMQSLGGSLSIEKYTNIDAIKHLTIVANSKNKIGELSFYKVDASGLDLISSKKKQRLNHNDLADMCSQRAVLKAASKYYKAVMKEIKGRVDHKLLKETGEQRTICSSFALYSESILEQLSKSGFDIYTGAYSTNNKVLPNKGAGSGATEKEFEVVYEIGSKIEKLTGDAVRQAVINNDNSVLDSVTLKKLAAIENIKDDIAKYTAANKGLKEAQLMLENFEKLLWVHNASILNNLAISSDEAKLWKPYASRAKAYDVYQSTAVEKLIIKLRGIRMA